MRNRYNITDINDQVNVEIMSWLRNNLTQEQYEVIDDGFLISSYNLYFNDERAEILYLLRWQ